jgi:hypothetical protein
MLGIYYGREDDFLGFRDDFLAGVNSVFPATSRGFRKRPQSNSPAFCGYFPVSGRARAAFVCRMCSGANSHESRLSAAMTKSGPVFQHREARPRSRKSYSLP